MGSPGERAMGAGQRVLDAPWLDSPWTALVLGAVGAGLGFAVLFVESEDARATVFRTPAFVTWIILYIGQIALWLVLAPSAWRAAIRAGETFGPIRWTGLGIGLVLLLVALFLPGALSPHLPGLPITNGRGDEHLQQFLGSLTWRVGATVLIALLVLLVPSVVEIWIVQDAASRPGMVAPTPTGTAANTDWAPGIGRYLAARDHLQAALVRLGVAISALTVVTAQLRNAEVAYINPAASGSAADAIFPNTYVLLYGLYYTALVALIYLPAARALASAGQELRRQMVEPRTIDSSTVGTWFQLRKNVGDLLQLDADPLGQLKTAVSILAPLVGSIVGVSAGK